MIRKIAIPVSAIITFILSTSVFSCSVPVFRYALERWQPDPYTVRIFYKDKLDQEQQTAVDYLKKYGEDGGPIMLEIIDISQEIPVGALPVLSRYKEDKLPLAVVNYPIYSRIPNDAVSFSLTLKNVEQLMQSPARNELARRLLKGDSAVFIQVDGENEEENKKVAKKVEKILKEMEKELKLPHEMLDEGEKLDEESMQYDTNIKIKFSLQRVSHNAPNEKLFLQLFLNCEKSLQGKKTPIIMPVFGRGRALFAYMDAGITKENIFEAGEYLSGPCSCEIKAQNPGFDLLMAIEWNKLVDDTINIDEALPPLTGLTTLVVKEQPIEIPQENVDIKAAAKLEEKPEDQRLPAQIFMTLAGLVIISFIVMKYVLKGR